MSLFNDSCSNHILICFKILTLLSMIDKLLLFINLGCKLTKFKIQDVNYNSIINLEGVSVKSQIVFFFLGC